MHTEVKFIHVFKGQSGLWHDLVYKGGDIYVVGVLVTEIVNQFSLTPDEKSDHFKVVSGEYQGLEIFKRNLYNSVSEAQSSAEKLLLFHKENMRAALANQVALTKQAETSQVHTKFSY